MAGLGVRTQRGMITELHWRAAQSRLAELPPGYLGSKSDVLLGKASS